MKYRELSKGGQSKDRGEDWLEVEGRGSKRKSRTWPLHLGPPLDITKGKVERQLTWADLLKAEHPSHASCASQPIQPAQVQQGRYNSLPYSMCFKWRHDQVLKATDGTISVAVELAERCGPFKITIKFLKAGEQLRPAVRTSAREWQLWVDLQQQQNFSNHIHCHHNLETRPCSCVYVNERWGLFGLSWNTWRSLYNVERPKTPNYFGQITEDMPRSIFKCNCTEAQKLTRKTKNKLCLPLCHTHTGQALQAEGRVLMPLLNSCQYEVAPTTQKNV